MVHICRSREGYNIHYGSSVERCIAAGVMYLTTCSCSVQYKSMFGSCCFKPSILVNVFHDLTILIYCIVTAFAATPNLTLFQEFKVLYKLFLLLWFVEFMWSISADLVGRMTTVEKISQLGNTAQAIERLRIPSYQWWSEALHGIARSPGVHFEGNVRKHNREFVFLHQTNHTRVHRQNDSTNGQMLSIRTQCLFSVDPECHLFPTSYRTWCHLQHVWDWMILLF